MDNRRTCKHCNRKLNFEVKMGAKYCSHKCRNDFYNLKRRNNLMSYGYNMDLKAATRGAISELKVCADLMEKGYEVFRSLSHNCSCDLAVLKDKNLFRVEVKSNTYTYSKKPHRIDPKKIKADIFAQVMPDKIIYEFMNEETRNLLAKLKTSCE